MRAKDFIKEDDEPIRIKIGGGGDTLAKKFVKHLYDTYPRSPINNREFYIAFSDEEFAMFEVQARAGSADTAYVSWMSAYPQRQGIGTRALQQLQQEAADFGVNLELIAWDKGNVSKAALTRFYKKNGFKKGMGDMLKWQRPIEEDKETARLDITAKQFGKRTFFEAYLNPEADETPTWLRVAYKPKLVAEVTAEITSEGKGHIGFIQAHREGKGFATELVKYVLQYYQEQGVTEFYCYINHENAGSKGVFRKLGFTETKVQRDGSFWTL